MLSLALLLLSIQHSLGLKRPLEPAVNDNNWLELSKCMLVWKKFSQNSVPYLEKSILLGANSIDTVPTLYSHCCLWWSTVLTWSHYQRDSWDMKTRSVSLFGEECPQSKHTLVTLTSNVSNLRSPNVSALKAYFLLNSKWAHRTHLSI